MPRKRCFSSEVAHKSPRSFAVVFGCTVFRFRCRPARSPAARAHKRPAPSQTSFTKGPRSRRPHSAWRGGHREPAARPELKGGTTASATGF
ncbi:MAG: hypothetical protein BJ554DRAFT_4245 [Olpidium bornovanus]|uniref:Uncharacterized protein n=1 Tax=Olpidium bornovanus TaxID=278681 RepID=A0A8H7ZMZ9_9FUNG|nr:MAG: hypothetical protein BJ554DRAFT_4245 [Olpidium bornovanus]